MMTVGLANYWHPVALATEVTDQPRRLRLLGEPLVLYRDNQGVVALSDLCIHRGAALSMGWITHGNITCAYHGWQYDRTGVCVRIPSLPDGHTVPRKARTNAYQAKESYGLVWVAMAEPAAPLPQFPQDEWNDPNYHHFLIGEWEVKSSAGRVVENSLDFSHFSWVHEGILGSRDNAVIAPYTVKETETGLEVVGDRLPLSNSQSGPDAAFLRMEHYLFVPFTMFSRTSFSSSSDRVTLFLTACPLDKKTSRVFYFQLRDHNLDAPDDEYREYSTTVILQDRAIIESQRPEEIPLDLREELHIKVPDAAAVLYRKRLAQVGVDQIGEYGP